MAITVDGYCSQGLELRQLHNVLVEDEIGNRAAVAEKYAKVVVLAHSLVKAAGAHHPFSTIKFAETVRKEKLECQNETRYFRTKENSKNDRSTQFPCNSDRTLPSDAHLEQGLQRRRIPDLVPLDSTQPH